MIRRRYTALIRRHYALISPLQAIPSSRLPTNRLRDHPVVFTVIARRPPLELRYSLMLWRAMVDHFLETRLLVTDTRLHTLYFLAELADIILNFTLEKFINLLYQLLLV